MSIKNIQQLIKEHEVNFVDLRFTDTKGKEQHVSIGASCVDEDFLTHGKMFDGSSIVGWKTINESDMILLPDINTSFLDPFFEQPTLVMRCDVIEPNTQQAYERDPRSLAKRAESYLKSTGIADTCFFGPEPEFFIFDEVHWKVDMSGSFYAIDSEEAAWNSDTLYESGNMGHRPSVKGGYFPVPPVDSAQNIRSAMTGLMEEIGIVVEAHHHEVATAGQQEINTRFNTLLKKADELQTIKYIVHNVAYTYGKTATFMPKPVINDNGNGMHCHQSLFKGGKNIFSGSSPDYLSQQALYYIGGIMKHARALNAFTNPATNSYKRLVPGFEAPVMLAYSSRNRSAAIRIPYVINPKAARIEVRFPDPAANPYLAFSAMMMAGLDGIQNKIDPGAATNTDLYRLSIAEAKKIPTISSSLEQALQALDEDRDFLKQGNVFSDTMLNAYIELKMAEVKRYHLTTHPIEFEMYYSV